MSLYRRREDIEELDNGRQTCQGKHPEHFIFFKNKVVDKTLTSHRLLSQSGLETNGGQLLTHRLLKRLRNFCMST